jgi:pimeloyl-ACP methyl ester carboxylesterase
MRSAFFLEGSTGSLFCTGFLHPPETGQRRRFLIISPFAEELNKSRHVLAALAAAIGEAGHDVLMPDLFGTGDSAGDFSQATLGIWRTDLDTVIECLGVADGLELIGCLPDYEAVVIDAAGEIYYSTGLADPGSADGDLTSSTPLTDTCDRPQP